MLPIRARRAKAHRATVGHHFRVACANPRPATCRPMKLTGASLLLLEDEPLFRRRLVSHLEKLGMAVTSTTTVAEARTALKNLDFDFALFDVNLPDGRSLALLDDK